MKQLLTCMLIMCAIGVSAQTTEDDALTAKVFALDTSIAGAKVFNNELAKQIGGFSLAFIDSTKPRTMMYVYKTPANENLRIEIMYRNEEPGEGQSASNKQVVHYQRITATDVTMSRIFNYLFNIQVQVDQLRAFSSTGSAVKYKSGSYMYMLDEAEFRPGYWELTFIKS